MDQLVAFGAGYDRPLVGEDGGAVLSERDPTEAGDQRFASSVAGACRDQQDRDHVHFYAHQNRRRDRED